MKCDYFSEILKIKTSIKALLNINNVSYPEITQKDRESTPFCMYTFHWWEWTSNLSFRGDTIWAKCPKETVCWRWNIKKSVGKTILVSATGWSIFVISVERVFQKSFDLSWLFLVSFHFILLFFFGQWFIFFTMIYYSFSLQEITYGVAW